METPQLVDKNSSYYGRDTQKLAKKFFFLALTPIGNRQHNDVQNGRSLGMNLSLLNEKENSWEKGGYPP